MTADRREELRGRIEAALDAAGCAPLLATRLSRVVLPVMEEELRMATDAGGVAPWWGHIPKVIDPAAGGSVGEWLRDRVTPATIAPADRERAIKNTVIRKDACGRYLTDDEAHEVYDPECDACIEASSDAPEWTI